MEQLLSGILLDFWLLILGVFFILVVMFWPDGFAGLLKKAGSMLRRSRSTQKGDGHHAA